MTIASSSFDDKSGTGNGNMKMTCSAQVTLSQPVKGADLTHLGPQTGGTLHFGIGGQWATGRTMNVDWEFTCSLPICSSPVIVDVACDGVDRTTSGPDCDEPKSVQVSCYP